MIDLFFTFFNQISIGLLLSMFVVMWIKKCLSGQTDILEPLIATAFASTTIPTAIALILCAFDKSLVSKLNDMSLPLAVAGLVLLFVTLKTIEKDW